MKTYRITIECIEHEQDVPTAAGTVERKKERVHVLTKVMPGHELESRGCFSYVDYHQKRRTFSPLTTEVMAMAEEFWNALPKTIG